MSSGCESGWTMYFDQHFNSTDEYSNKNSDKHYQRKGTYVNEEEEDDDLSMVSDASSGPPPPQFHVYENCAEKKKKKNRMKERKGEGKNLYLDDTASSPLCNSSQDELGTATAHTSMDHVPGFSPALPTATSHKVWGFFKSSQKEKTASAKSGGLLGRKRQ